MKTIILYLLISSGVSHSGAVAPHQVMERFVDREDCEEVRRQALTASGKYAPNLTCIRARVYQP